eukprot:EG_transcript_9207
MLTAPSDGHPIPSWKLVSAASLLMAMVWLGYVLFSPEVAAWGHWLRLQSAQLWANHTQVAQVAPRLALPGQNTTAPPAAGSPPAANVSAGNAEAAAEPVTGDANGTGSLAPPNATAGEEEEEDSAAANFTLPDDNATLATVLGAALANGTAPAHPTAFRLLPCSERERSALSERLADFLHRAWHPPDCAALTTVEVGLVNSGLGARLNMLGPALVCLAASRGLPLLHHNNVYVNHRVCPSGDLDCYFLPLSNCTAHRRGHLKMEEHLRRRSLVQADCPKAVRQAAGLPATASDAWVTKEVLQYYMRPNLRLRSFVESVATQQGLRAPYMAIHLRTGQRFTWQNEKKKFNGRAVADQLKQWVDHARQAGHHSIFFASDLPSMVGTLARLAEGTGVAVTIVPPGLFPTMRSPPNQRAEQYLQTYYRTHATDLDEGLALLGTFLLLSSATETVVTQSSNVGVVIRSLMWCGDREPNLTVTFPKPYGLPVNKKRQPRKGG